LVEKQNFLHFLLSLQAPLNTEAPQLDATGVFEMGVYFMTNWHQARRRQWRCLFCESLFDSRSTLNDHYLDEHESAFTEEELSMARLQHTHQVQDANRSPVQSEP